MKYILLPILLFVSFTAEAAEFLLAPGFIYTGSKHDKICDDAICREVDSRFRYGFEMILLSGKKDTNRGVFYWGGLRGMNSASSLTYVGGGFHGRPFPNGAERLWVRVSIEVGRKTLQHSQNFRLAVCPMYQPRSQRWYTLWADLVAWCHRSTGRKLFNLGSLSKGERNQAVNGFFFNYYVLRDN